MIDAEKCGKQTSYDVTTSDFDVRICFYLTQMSVSVEISPVASTCLHVRKQQRHNEVREFFFLSRIVVRQKIY